MKLSGCTKNDVDKDKDEEIKPKLESVEVVLVYVIQSKMIINTFKSFVQNKQFGQLINISPHSLIMVNTVNTKFSYVWFTDQASKALESEDNVNLTVVTGQSL